MDIPRPLALLPAAEDADASIYAVSNDDELQNLYDPYIPYVEPSIQTITDESPPPRPWILFPL